MKSDAIAHSSGFSIGSSFLNAIAIYINADPLRPKLLSRCNQNSSIPAAQIVNHILRSHLEQGKHPLYHDGWGWDKANIWFVLRHADLVKNLTIFRSRVGFIRTISRKPDKWNNLCTD